jgi:hypothetical protein
MPNSQTAAELLAAGKLYYGDPCYDSLFGSTEAECEKQGNLALAVFRHYGIELANSWNAPKASCCPLDIVNQDPIACIKMSMMASLLQKEYWEVYADEWGKASFVKVLPEESAKVATLPRVQYCTPSLQPSDIANLVVVRSADPPPFRKCGKIKGQDWYDILDGSSYVGLRNVFANGSIFPGAGRAGAEDARGIMFSWGEVTGMGPSRSTDPTCEVGQFDQFGTIIYPDYERKQIYNDGVIDFYELEGFEQIMFWLVDVKYSATDDERSHYNIQFVKSSDVPMLLEPPTIGDTWRGHMQDFGVVCDVTDDGAGTGTSPNITYNLSSRLAIESCAGVQQAISAAKERKPSVSWDSYSIPSFFAYGYTMTTADFNDYSKWNIVGADECIEDPIDNMYESTSALWGNGCPLDNWYVISFTSTAIFFGMQKGKRTIELPQAHTWVESGDQNGKLIYSLRAEAPGSATTSTNSQPWINPFHNYMLTPISNAREGEASSSFTDVYKYPGNLFGWDNGMYLINELWAKTKVSRPGIAIQGFGRGVRNFLPKVSLRIKPVYQVDFPAAIAARGDTYNGCVDVYRDLANANQAYCKPISTGSTEAEKLQEAMTGNTIDITIPFLFPDFAGIGQRKPSDVKDKSAFDALCKTCLDVASFLWDYISKYKNEPYKGYTYICGPPKSQAEVPKLGDVVETEHGRRTINSLAYSYSDSSSFTLNVEVGPVSIAAAHAGSITSKRKKNEDVKGKIVDQGMGALYKVDIPSLGIIQAWNIDRYPWDVGDKVSVTLYNHPMEL